MFTYVTFVLLLMVVSYVTAWPVDDGHRLIIDYRSIISIDYSFKMRHLLSLLSPCESIKKIK